MPDLTEKGISFDSGVIASALENIYRKRFNVRTAIEPGLFRATVEKLNLAAATGISDAVDGGVPMPGDRFLTAIKHSNEVFAAFRTHRMQNDIAQQMTDSKGNLKSFSQFAKDVKPYTDHQNRAWLRTEYDTAVIRAHRAADWQQFEAEKDVLPNLEWTPSTSPNPGEDHRPFWGTVLPIDDPFWNEHKPGDRWNCKCSLRNTDKQAGTVPTGGQKDMPARGLENNPGKDGHLFSDKHSYFPDSCGSCPFAGNKLAALFSDLAGKKNCYQCKRVDKAVEQTAIDKARKEYEAFNPDVYAKTFFDAKSNGYVVTERKRLAAAKANKQEAAKYAKEKAMCLAFAKGGNKIVHLGEVARISSADVTCNGMKADLKRTGSENNMIDYAKHARKSQGAKLVLFQFDKWNAKMASALKEITKLKIHGKYFITGRDNEIIDF